ncbi:hypothetical protein MKX01_025247 [Papaver californicum]|nr:hypothetical protein MKX01_025247 [Papaver californicum]
MDSSASTTDLFPLHRTKTLHLVRHAQGVHNIEEEKDFSVYEFFDVHNLHKHVHECGLAKKIVSSLLMYSFPWLLSDGCHATMVENAGNSNHSAISSLSSPPFVSVELCREQLVCLGVHPCDRRRSTSGYHTIFTAIDFSLEIEKDVATRGMEFINWLWTRIEKEIPVVTHSASCFRPSVHLETIATQHFANCELRSVVIVDSGLIGSDTSVTKYPGKILNELDRPTDAALDKGPEQGAPKS